MPKKVANRLRDVLAPADLTEIEDGLWRWTARHPAWIPAAEPESPADWPAEVASVAYSTPQSLVLIDPLVPADADALWAWLDDRAAEHGRVAVLTTLKWHRRSRDEVAKRYGASTSRARAALPEGVETIAIRGAGETMIWLPRQATLIAGDRLMGDGNGGLRMCPESWLSYLPNHISLTQLREALHPLLDLDPERVLVSHGQAVMHGGTAAIERALS